MLIETAHPLRYREEPSLLPSMFQTHSTFELSPLTALSLGAWGVLLLHQESLLWKQLAGLTPLEIPCVHAERCALCRSLSIEVIQPPLGVALWIFVIALMKGLDEAFSSQRLYLTNFIN